MAGTCKEGPRRIAPLVLTALVLAAPAVTADTWLVTPEEAARARPPGRALEQTVAATPGPGPRVVVKNPKALERIVSPVEILVTFEPGDSGQPPDMGTFSATLIGFIDIDITDRVRDYVAGSRLHVENADLPQGHHQIRLAIKDIAGNPNERDLEITVVARE